MYGRIFGKLTEVTDRGWKMEGTFEARIHGSGEQAAVHFLKAAADKPALRKELSEYYSRLEFYGQISYFQSFICS